jgi:rhodanese-related sulfurtransferase
LLFAALFAFFGLSSFALANDADAPKDSKQPAKSVEVKKISLEEFDKLRQEKDALVIDVRTPAEYESGHVPGAINLPLAADDFDARVKKLTESKDNKKHLVYCAIGGRSAKATARMAELGLANVHNFSGSMKVWKEAEKPVVKGREPK